MDALESSTGNLRLWVGSQEAGKGWKILFGGFSGDQPVAGRCQEPFLVTRIGEIPCGYGNQGDFYIFGGKAWKILE